MNATGWAGVQVQRLGAVQPDRIEADQVIDEQPVALVFNGLSHVVMMATPTDLEDLGVGFALSEGLIADLSALRDVEVERHDQGWSVHLTVSSQAFAALKDRRRLQPPHRPWPRCPPTHGLRPSHGPGRSCPITSPCRR